MSKKNFNDTTGNRNHDLPAYGAVPKYVCVCVEKSSALNVCQLLNILAYPYIIQCTGIRCYWHGMV